MTPSGLRSGTIQSALLGGGEAVSSRRAMAIPAGSLPWMHPITSTVLVALTTPILIARIGRASTDRPIVTWRALGRAACSDARA